ncbi:MAG: amino acid decarboxylase, partial [Oscillospiraceae bacterium]
YHIMPEFISDNGCVFLFSPYNDGCDFDRVNDAILSAPLSAPIALSYNLPQTISLVDLRTAVFSPKEELLIQDAVGRVSAEVKSPCPPGIPLIMPGEVLTRESTEILLQYGVSSINVIK